MPLALRLFSQSGLWPPLLVASLQVLSRRDRWRFTMEPWQLPIPMLNFVEVPWFDELVFQKDPDVHTNLVFQESHPSTVWGLLPG